MPRYIWDGERMVEVPYDRDLPRPPSVFPMIQRDLPAYFSVASGRWVDGRRERREDLARTGCREVDPSEFKPVAWNPDFARRYGLKHEPPPPVPDYVKEWREGRGVERAPVEVKPATPEQIRAEIEAYRAEKAKRAARTS